MTMCGVKWCVAEAVKDGYCAAHARYPSYKPAPASSGLLASIWERLRLGKKPKPTDDELDAA